MPHKWNSNRIFKYLIVFTLFLSFYEFRPQDISFPGKSAAQPFPQENPKQPFAIVGDLQRTSLAEMLMGRESNDLERILLIDEIVKEKPEKLVILGDMIFDGSDDAQWAEFDKLLIPVKRSKIPVYPVLGNHEYWGYNYPAELNFKKRFAQFRRSTWYTEKYDSLALVFLNSNEEDLTAEDWQRQQKWYNNLLKECDRDPSVKGVLVFLHHPPYTNSIVTGDELNVQLAFLPGYFKCKKSLAMISGHAHTYERFIKDGKIFIVSGGGGGPRVGIKDGIDFHKDLYTGKSPRPFHFLLVSRDNTGVKVTVRGLLKGSKAFFTMEQFYLSFANEPVTAAR